MPVPRHPGYWSFEQCRWIDDDERYLPAPERVADETGASGPDRPAPAIPVRVPEPRPAANGRTQDVRRS